MLCLLSTLPMQLKALRGSDELAEGEEPLDPDALRLHTYVEAAMEAISLRYLKSMVNRTSLRLLDQLLYQLALHHANATTNPTP